ncbi:oxygen-dependent tRNA uridine(34) hydroxylase TrhO [Haploplasma modicum]|uniref:oxygen-dependent tRNA uridine(34) hydroxylase TrhO n=1 Tax=Haploplasma modicum TaxID=2150 RepID=UPI00214C3ADB|nr:rhodanese-related sulfurtransferase [Haploplasma modicum]MCR1809196.1 rhodanese-related sulfurtransferase [Haploplasma modicum]
MENNYQVLLYYKYIKIDNPDDFAKKHLNYCKELGVLGRIIISNEGINGTLSGTVDQTSKYMNDLRNDARFKDIMFKVDKSDKHAFSKIHVRSRKEIVNFSLEDDVDPSILTGNYLKPDEWYQAMNDENTVIIDARNDYEYDLGHFRNAIKPEIKTFRDLPNWVRENKNLFENKKILTYCTGGVRCEKFSGWLKREGFSDVNQLEGGIHTYGTDSVVRGNLFDGKMYVFDERLSTRINMVEEVIVGKDYYTDLPCERYVNCGNPECNKQMILSLESEEKYLQSCSKECMLNKRNRYVIANNISDEDVLKIVGNLKL